MYTVMAVQQTTPLVLSERADRRGQKMILAESTDRDLMEKYGWIEWPAGENPLVNLERWR